MPDVTGAEAKAILSSEKAPVGTFIVHLPPRIEADRDPFAKVIPSFGFTVLQNNDNNILCRSSKHRLLEIYREVNRISIKYQ